MGHDQTTDIGANLQDVRARIAEAALRSGREAKDVTLVAVTKTFPVAAIMAAWQAGQRHFGENRPEEGARKIPQVMREITARRLPTISPSLAGGEAASQPGESPGVPIWHMIGHIQSRKTDLVLKHFDIVHSIDRLKIARRLSVFGEETGHDLPVLLECNVSGEESKYGYDAAGWENDSDVRAALLAEIKEVVALPNLQVCGLMTVAPIVDDPEAARPVFVSLRALRDFLQDEVPSVDWHHLSMGMTADYAIAVEEGATLVRVGRAIFGARQY